MRGHVREIEPGTWRVWVENGRDPLTGRRRRITRTLHDVTEQQAEEEAMRIVLGVRDQTEPTAAAASVGQLLDAWLEHANLEAWTRIGYRSKIETHIRPALGDLKLAQLTTFRLDAYYGELRKRGRSLPKGKRGPLSVQSVKHVHAIIRRACEQAVIWGWLDRNPAARTAKLSVDQQQRALPAVADVLKIVEKLDVDMRELAWLAIVTGARRGELCGLRWSDIKTQTVLFDDEPIEVGQITIARSIADTPDELIVKATKTNKVRKPALDPITIALLAARQERHTAEAINCKTNLGPDGYVFPEAPGGRHPLKPAIVSKRWANAARAAKVTCRFHDLRHLAASELMEAGFDVVGVSLRLGHANPSTTMNIYGHSRGSHDLAASQYLAALMAPKVEPAPTAE